MNPNEKKMCLFSENLNHLWHENKLEEAKMLLMSEVQKYPYEYFLWTSLAQTCSGLEEYSLALEYSRKAMSLCDDDVLTIYNHIVSLVHTKSYAEALQFCLQILKESINEIALNGEGIKWAKSIRNDTMYLKAVCLYNMSLYGDALDTLQELQTLRQRGIYSDFSKKQIMNEIRMVKQHLSNE